MPAIPAAPFVPDAAPLAGGTAVASGVYPCTAADYGPLGAVALLGGSNSLTATCVGAIGVQSVYGVPMVIAGTAAGLYQLPVSTTLATLATGYNATAWRFAQFKNTVLATDSSTGLLSIDLSALTVTAFTAAPKAVHVAVIKSFAFLADTYDPVGGAAPFRVWWSAINDPTSWPTPGSNTAVADQSDYNDNAGAMGAITGLVSDLANADGAIFYAHGIRRVLYTGPSDVFQVPVAEGAKGCQSPRSIVQFGALVYYRGEDGFYAFDGATSTPIGAGRVDKWLAAQPSVNLATLIGAYDGTTRCVVWASTEAGLLLFYSVPFDRWSYAYVACEFVFQMLDLITGLPRLGLYTTTHNAAVMSGPALAASVSTVEMQPVPNFRAFVPYVRPLTDGGTPTVSINSRNRLSDPQVIGTPVSMSQSGICPVRTDGRYLQAVVQQPAGAVWTHISGVDAMAVPSGAR